MALHFILDGYNVMKTVSWLAEKPFDEGRRAFLSWLIHARPQGSTRNQVTVVFDGQPGNCEGWPSSPRVRVVFSRDETADEWIKNTLEKIPRRRDCVVVTNDKELRFYARSCGCQVNGVEEFAGKALASSSSFVASTIEESPESAKPFLSKVKEQQINEELARLWLKKKKKG